MGVSLKVGSTSLQMSSIKSGTANICLSNNGVTYYAPVGLGKTSNSFCFKHSGSTYHTLSPLGQITIEVLNRSTRQVRIDVDNLPFTSNNITKVEIVANTTSIATFTSGGSRTATYPNIATILFHVRLTRDLNGKYAYSDSVALLEDEYSKYTFAVRVVQGSFGVSHSTHTVTAANVVQYEDVRINTYEPGTSRKDFYITTTTSTWGSSYQYSNTFDYVDDVSTNNISLTDLYSKKFYMLGTTTMGDSHQGLNVNVRFVIKDSLGYQYTLSSTFGQLFGTGNGTEKYYAVAGLGAHLISKE